MTQPAFNLSALLSRVAAVTIATPPPVVLHAATIQRRDAAKNPRTVASIIDESGELESHSLSDCEPVDNVNPLLDDIEG